MKTKEAIEWGGGTEQALAVVLGITQPAVNQWGEYPPDEQQLRIQLKSGGALVAESWALDPKKKVA
jgi:DNA-binding transcriptional regulator YdaS (Cro superfamily)